jgi:GDP-L-fucose synthase
MGVFKFRPDTKVYVAGHRGMVGSAVLRNMQANGIQNLVFASSSDLDLRDRAATQSFFETEKPEVVYLAAAKVGGIMANDSYPAEFLSDNLRIQLNVMDAAHSVGVERLVFFGSSCIYPKFAPQPIREDALMTGALEETNDAYAVAKIAGIQQVKAMRKQHGRSWISVMPSNLYGPGDNYDPHNSHVLPALIRRYSEAKQKGLDEVTNWGSGEPRREFLFSDDLADAAFFLAENFDGAEHVNVGSGTDLTIRELAEMVAKHVGYQGKTNWDTSKPDGTPRKLMDSSKIQQMGWEPSTTIEDGIQLAVEDYRARFGN